MRTDTQRNYLKLLNEISLYTSRLKHKRPINDCFKWDNFERKYLVNKIINLNDLHKIYKYLYGGETFEKIVGWQYNVEDDNMEPQKELVRISDKFDYHKGYFCGKRINCIA